MVSIPVPCTSVLFFHTITNGDWVHTHTHTIVHILHSLFFSCFQFQRDLSTFLTYPLFFWFFLKRFAHSLSHTWKRIYHILLTTLTHPPLLTNDAIFPLFLFSRAFRSRPLQSLSLSHQYYIRFTQSHALPHTNGFAHLNANSYITIFLRSYNSFTSVVVVATSLHYYYCCKIIITTNVVIIIMFMIFIPFQNTSSLSRLILLLLLHTQLLNHYNQIH